jgi:hypothetical protein
MNRLAGSGLLSSALVAGVAACVPSDLSAARDLIDSGDYFQGSQAMDAAAKNRPNDPELQTEARLAKHAFLRDVLSRDVEPRLERIELAMRWISDGVTEPVEVQQYLLRRLAFAEETQRWDMAIETALTMKQPERAARIAMIRLQPQSANARLIELSEKFPNDASVCEIYAGFLLDARQNTAALKEYQRCLKLPDKTTDQAVIFKEQIASLKNTGSKKHKK